MPGFLYCSRVSNEAQMHFYITPHFTLICTGLTKKASGNLGDNAICFCYAFGVPVVVRVHVRAPSTCQFS